MPSPSIFSLHPALSWPFSASLPRPNTASSTCSGGWAWRLLVDGIDGPIARKVRVKEVLPNWSGDTLDNVIDYVTYVLLPAFALYQSGMIGEPWSFVAAGAIVVSSAIYYADMGMKTDEYFFSGFPVVWNMVVFTLFVIDASEIDGLDRRLRLGVPDLPADQFPASGPRPAACGRSISASLPSGRCSASMRCLLHFDTPAWVVAGVVVHRASISTSSVSSCRFFPALGRRLRRCHGTGDYGARDLAGRMF